MIHEKEEDRSRVLCAQSHSRNHSEEPPVTGEPGRSQATRRYSTIGTEVPAAFSMETPHTCVFYH